MFGLGPATRIYLAVGSTDLRKGFEGLHGMVRDRLGLEPPSGHVVLFCNRCRNRVSDYRKKHETLSLPVTHRLGSGPDQPSRYLATSRQQVKK